MIRKLWITLICSVLAISATSQTFPTDRKDGADIRDRSFYLYKSFEDFKGHSGEHFGNFRTFKSSYTNKGMMLYIEPDEETCIILYDKGNWGFEVGNLLFRIMDGETPLRLLGAYNGKILYHYGRMDLTLVANNNNESKLFDEDDQFFYSETPTSEIIKFSKLEKLMKDNADFAPLAKCLKEARSEKGVVEQFRQKRLCLLDFAEELD